MSPGTSKNIELPLSPGAGFCMRDHNFKQASNNSYLAALAGGQAIMDQLSPRSDGAGMNYCACGLPMRLDQETCD